MVRIVMLGMAGLLLAGPAGAQMAQTTACAQYEVMDATAQKLAIQNALKAESQTSSSLNVTSGQLAVALSNGCPTNPDKRLVDFVRELAQQH